MSIENKNNYLYQNKNFITECIYGYGPTLDQLECKKCKNGCSSCIFYGNTEVCKSCFVENEGCYGNKCRRAIKTELKLSPNDNNSIFEDISKYKDFNEQLIKLSRCTSREMR